MIGFIEKNKDDDDDNIQEILILLHPIHNCNHSLCTQLVNIPDSTGSQRILPVLDVWRHLILSHL